MTFDADRLAMLRDLIAALRAFSRDDVVVTNEVLRPYQGDAETEIELTKELVEVVSGFLSTADDFGLPAQSLVAHVVSDVPADLRPFYEEAGRIILGVHEQSDVANEDTNFETFEEFDGFVKALLNLGVFLVRQIARSGGVSEDSIYDATASRLAIE